MQDIDAMPVEDFVAWQAYHSLYPIDGTREDYRSALQCQVTAATVGGDFDVEDFIPRFGPQQQQPIEEHLAYFKILAARTAK